MDDQSFEVNLIEGLTSEHEEELEYESKHEFDIESVDLNFDQIVRVGNKRNPEYSLARRITLDGSYPFL